MKTISRLFMAVVAGMLAFSCVTDTTEDLGVNLGEGQSTTIDISLEESRTHLGVKDPIGNEYPLYWSKGDKIAVNGEASDELGEEYHGQTQATFKFTGTLLNYPYNIVYPAPAEGVTAEKAGQQVVTFKTSQVYTAGSFAEGSVPMYGYVEDENDATTLNHLTGVLRIALYGTGVTLNAMTLSAESGKLSGNFDVNCTTGELTAHADASNTLSVSFGTGLTIATTEAAATPIYVAVPEGTYGKITITFYSSKGAMTKSFDTAEKPITAGSVREFAALEYEEGTTDTFIIYDEASLRNFANSINDTDAENVAAFNTTYPKARVVADIELTEPWTSINGYTGSFDGGNHTISGLKASLFGTTQASAIKNVHLTDVDIESSLTKLGAIACYVTNTSAEITNCSAEGKLILQGPSVGKYYVAGLFGYIDSTEEVSNLENSVDVTFTNKGYGFLAGCIATTTGSINNCRNLGTVTYNATSTSSEALWIGGVCGLLNATDKTIQNCYNGKLNQDGTPSAEYGKIIYNGSQVGLLTIYGISSYQTNVTVSDCINYAPIEVAGAHPSGSKKYLSVAGVCAGPNSAYVPGEIKNCKNYGGITIGVDASAATAATWIGGVTAGYINNPNNNLENHGTITITDSAKFKQALYIGGVYGGLAGLKSGSGLKNTGNIYMNALKENVKNNVSIGGIINQDNKVTALTDSYCYCDIVAPGWTNVGMVVGTTYKDTYTQCHIGGSILRGTMKTAEKLSLSNYPAYACGSGVTVENPATDAEKTLVNTLRFGWLSESIDSSVQYKSFPIVEIGSEADFLVWAATAAESAESVVLTADIDLSKVTDWSALGEGVTAWKPIEGFNGIFDGGNRTISGLKAPLFGTIKASVIKNVHLTGVDITSNLYPLGALACKVNNTVAIIQDCSADGTLTFTDSSLASSKQPCVAGMIGYTTTETTITGLVNSVDVTFNHNSAVYLAGCIGQTASSIENCKNLGTITYASGCKATKTIWMAGVCADCTVLYSTATKCVNGSTDADGKPTEEGKLVFAGENSGLLIVSGIATMRSNSTVSGCTNYAPIEIGGIQTGNNLQVAGVHSAPNDAHNNISTVGCINYGTITVTTNRTSTGELNVGGVFGGYGTPKNVTDCENHGAIDIDLTVNEGESPMSGVANIGGIISFARSGADLSGSKNKGSITVTQGCTTVANTYIGGIAGQSLATINETRCFCTVIALGYANVGMLTGSARNATAPKVNNCAVGGKIATSTTAEGEAERPNEINLSAGNYYNYIYGSANWTGVADYDGCGYIESIDDDTPEYATPQPEE